MPQNTQQNAGTSVGYQNPATTNLTLDSEVVGVDPSSNNAQLTREFVIPTESVSGQSPDTIVVEVLGKILTELKKIRTIMELEAMPGLVDSIEEGTPVSDEVDSEESEGT